MRFCKLIGLYVLFTVLTTFELLGNTASANNIQKPTNKLIKLSKSDISAVNIIQKTIDKPNWEMVKKNIFKIENPLLRKALFWKYCVSPNSGATFHEIVKLIKENPNWPLMTRLRQRVEESMKPRMNPEHVIVWFKDHTPITTDGGIRLGEALLKVSRKSEAVKILRKTWVEGNFGAKQERQFYKRYRRYLTRQDHLDRLDRLLWKGRYYPVRRMLHKVNKDYRALAFARITLRRYRGSVDRAISKVPKKLLNDPGLVFERLRWRRRKGRNNDAIKMLKDLPNTLDHSVRLWNEKEILTRRFLQAGHISQAYNIASNHGLHYGKSFVEAEWLAGWIALRFLNESSVALNHFIAVFKGSQYPISRARGAYWAGRASETSKDQKKIESWYKKAAAYHLTYYGQHANAKLNLSHAIIIPEGDQIKDKDNHKFKTNELVKVVNVLGKAKMIDFIRPFIKKLNEIKSSATWHNNVAILARESGRPDLAVYTAKQAYRRGITLMREGYPVLNIFENTVIDLAFLYALIRQESAFNIKAVSHAGARGLMQIMPTTAKRIAKKYKIPYHKHNLTTDINYNLKLGQIYLSGLLNQFNGSRILSLTAYNAGPSRANTWIKRNGDPRNIGVDEIDWVEMIPFKETRNYVQRVIENFNVYRTYLNKNKNLSIQKD